MIFKRHDSIGLDWGTKELKWARVLTQPATGRTHLLFLETLTVPEDEKELLPLLKKFVAEKKLSGMPTAVGLKDERLHIRRMELPRMPEEDIKEAVRWQMRDIAEGSMDDYAVQYSISREEVHAEISRLSLLGYAMKKSPLLQLTMMLKHAGLKPFFAEPTPVSLAATLERIYPATENEWVVAVDIGWKQAYFLVVQEGHLQYVQSLAGVALATAMAEDPSYSTHLAVEIQRALDGFSITNTQAKIGKIFLAGSGAGISKLDASLSTNLGIPTAVLNPLEGIEGGEEFSEIRKKPYLFGVALGLAMLRP